jgi:hypothetical protein
VARVSARENLFQAFLQWGAKGLRTHQLRAKFYSSALVFLIKKLQEFDRHKNTAFASDFLNNLFQQASLGLQGAWEIESSIPEHSVSDPDIVIRAPGLLAFLKVSESKRPNRKRLDLQLRRIRSVLETQGEASNARTALLFLAPFVNRSYNHASVYEASWIKASELLVGIEKNLADMIADKDEAVDLCNLIRLFRRSLKENGLAVEKLHHAPDSGILPGLVNFLHQVQWALESLGFNAEKDGANFPINTRDWMGWNLRAGHKDPRYSCGIYLSSPSDIVVRRHDAEGRPIPQILSLPNSGGNWLPLQDGFEYRNLDSNYILEIRKSLPIGYIGSNVEDQVSQVQQIIKASLKLVDFKDAGSAPVNGLRLPAGCVKSGLDSPDNPPTSYFILSASTPPSKSRSNSGQRTLTLHRQARHPSYPFLASGCYLSPHGHS